MPIWEDLVLGQNAVIEASAGTGKTYTLEQIVKRLVTEKNYGIRDILLVTFTEKAAGELKERIRKALDNNEASKHLDDATICTIHAFCREVLSDYPFESGMMMEMDCGGSDDALCKKAVHNVLTSETFKEDYQNKFKVWMQYAGISTEDLSKQAIKKLKRVIDQENLLEECKREWNNLVELEKRATYDTQRKNVLNPQEFKNDYNALKARAQGDDTAKRFLEEHLKSKEKVKDFLFQNIAAKAYPEFIRLKHRSSNVTFDDLIRETARLVKEATEDGADDAKKTFVDRMRKRYKIALVDEFQDTDSKQWEIFKKLFADIGHLIVVGDPKQAIYGWRGADLGTYLEAKGKLQNNGQLMPLKEMFRSTPDMVDDYNTLFNNGWFNDMREGTYSIKYDGVSFPNMCQDKMPDKVKSLKEFNYPQDEHPVELLEAGSGIEGFLKNAANEMIRLHQDEVWKTRMEWNDMCVLVRSHADATKAQEILKEKRIPCRIYKEPGAFDSIEAESILALFDYLSRPRSLGTLSALLLTPLWNFSPEQLAQRLETGDSSFDSICEKWRIYAQKRDWVHLFESVIKNTKIRENASGYRQIFDTLLAKFGRAQSLSELARGLRKLKSGDEDAGENGTYRSLASEAPAVQIMTMHVAKGLEFNAVFIAAGFSGNATGGEEKRLFYVALTRAVFKLYLPWSKNNQNLGKNNSALRTFLGTAINKLLKGGDRWRDPGEQKIDESNNEKGNSKESHDLPPACGMRGWRFKWDSFSSLNHHKKAKPEVSSQNRSEEGEPDDSGGLDDSEQKSLVPKGHLAGTVFHEVMEKLCNNDGNGDNVGFEIGKKDFESLIAEDGQKSPLLEIVRRRLAANGVVNRVGKAGESTAVALARMAWNALRTELDFNGETFRLCDVELNARKAEVNFVLDESCLPSVSKEREGALNGSIDLLIRHNNHYYIIDWKTNSLDDYNKETVTSAMDDAGYRLQYMIYTLAAEKWLGKWLGKKVNGVAYLFVRGGEFKNDSPSGVFVHTISDKDRTGFADAFTKRISESDQAEETKDAEEGKL